MDADALLALLPHYAWIAVRTAAVYLIVIHAINRIGNEQVSTLSPADLVLVMLVGSSVQNSMIAADPSFGAGIVAVLTLLLTNVLHRRFRHRNQHLQHALRDDPVVLVQNGEVNEENLDRAAITDQELLAVLRDHGLWEPSQAEAVVLENNGRFSVLTTKPPSDLHLRWIE